MKNVAAIAAERALVARARAGNKKAFDALIREHSRKMYGISLRMLKNPEDAEDNLQKALVKAYKSFSSFEGTSQVSTWLVRITMNEALMARRKRKSERKYLVFENNYSEDDQHVLFNVRDTHADQERAVIAKELAEEAFRNLPTSLRDTFLLRQQEGWTTEELARAFGVTTETIKSRVFRARGRLRERMEALTQPAGQPATEAGF